MDTNTNEAREEGPIARGFLPPYTDRPGSRTILASTGDYSRWKLCRVGLTLDDAIDEELDDYRSGLAGATGRGISPEAYAEGEPDVALWDGERCLAVIRPRAGGDPEVTRFDERGGVR